MIDNAIYTLLAADGPVGGYVGDNIFPGAAPMEDLSAYVVYHLIDIVPENTKDGVSLLDQARVQIDCFHPDKTTCGLIATAIRTALDRYRGSAGGYTIDKIIFQNARNEFDEERKFHQVSQDFIIRHKK